MHLLPDTTIQKYHNISATNLKYIKFIGLHILLVILCFFLKNVLSKFLDRYLDYPENKEMNEITSNIQSKLTSKCLYRRELLCEIKDNQRSKINDLKRQYDYILPILREEKRNLETQKHNLINSYEYIKNIHIV